MKAISGTECEITKIDQKEVDLLNSNLKGKHLKINFPNGTEGEYGEVVNFRFPSSGKIFLDSKAVHNVECPIGTKFTIIK